jgi:transcriptional repressor NrdR
MWYNSRNATIETVKKVALPLFREGCGLLQRTCCAPAAHNSHVCRPRCIFSDAHVAGENDLILFRRSGGETLRGFFDKQNSRNATILLMARPPRPLWGNRRRPDPVFDLCRRAAPEVFCMKCPFCSYTESKVIDSRPAEEGTTIRRRRECLACQKRFTTYEVIEHLPLVVVKRDGSRQSFDRNKVLNGMLRSCEKRPVSMSQLEAIADEIEQELQNSFEREISTAEVGEMVMEHLKKVDEVAYVRFASVYRQFKDINTFMEELAKLLGDKTEN